MTFKERDAIEPARGTKEFVSLRVGELPDGSPVLMPIMAVAGAQEGPTLVVTGCLHGDEVLGTDIVRRVALTLDPAEMWGTFIGIPMASRPAVAIRNRRNLIELYPGAQDMNRVFPGNAKGIMSDSSGCTAILP